MQRRRAFSPSVFIAPEALEQAARELRALSHSQGIRIALVGGYALAQYGSTRLTGDLDVVASGCPRGLPLRDKLSFGGIRTFVGNVPTDVIQRNDSYAPLYAAALKAARLRRGSSKVAIVPLEYLAAMKLAAHRAKDLLDLDFIMRSGRLNVPTTRRIIGYYVGGTYAVADFDRMLTEAIWKKRNKIE